MRKEKRGRNKHSAAVVSSLPPLKASYMHVAYTTTNEDPELAQLPSYIALTKLSNCRGDRFSLERLYARLSLGRIIAHYHFDEPVAETIHDALRTMLDCMSAQHESDRMFMPAPDVKEIGTCLKLIDQMQERISRDDYTVAFYRFTKFEMSAVPPDYTERNMVHWDQFKEENGW